MYECVYKFLSDGIRWSERLENHSSKRYKEFLCNLLIQVFSLKVALIFSVILNASCNLSFMIHLW